MRKIGMTLLFFVIAQFAISQVKQNENGLYVNANGSLYSGALETNENGIMTVLQIKNGQPHGTVKYFHENGKVMKEGAYENGQRSGKWTTYNEVGSVTGISFYNAGKKDGTWIEWDDNGNKRMEMIYKNGEKTGVWKQWDENGAFFASKNYGGN